MQMEQRISEIDVALRQPQSAQTQASLRQVKQEHVIKLHQLMQPAGTHQQQMMQFSQSNPPPPAAPMQPNMQWAAQQQRASKRQLADPREVQQRALARLCRVPAPLPEKLGPDGTDALQRCRTLLEVQSALERSSAWMQEVPLATAANAPRPTEPLTWGAVRDRLGGWEARGERLRAKQHVSHEQLRSGMQLDSRRFAEALTALKQAASQQARARADGAPPPSHTYRSFTQLFFATSWPSPPPAHHAPCPYQDLDAVHMASQQERLGWRFRPAMVLQKQSNTLPLSKPAAGQMLLQAL